MYLKQSTAYTFRMGPFLDDTDGKTAETGLTISQADVRLSKNGGNFAQKTEASSSSHDEIGFYIVVLDTTDTNTVGELLVAVHESGALPVFKTFQVVEEAIYETLYAASADLESKLDTIDTVVDSILVDTAVIGALGAGLTAIPWNAAWDAEVQIECTDALNAYDPPTKAELDTAHSTTDALITTVDTVVDAILVDTAVIGAAGAGLTAVPWNASWDAEVQSEVTDALNAYDPPTKAEMDAMWTTDIVEAYAGPSETACTPAEMLYMILSCVGSYSISGDKITTLKLDESTQAMRFDMDSATNPTYRKRDA